MWCYSPQDRHNMQTKKEAGKTSLKSIGLKVLMCLRSDLNRHARESHGLRDQCVYQFRHGGIKKNALVPCGRGVFCL